MRFFLALGLAFGVVHSGLAAESCEATAQEKTGLLMSYDRNGSGKIDVRESLEAFPAFKADFIRLSGINRGWFAEAIYTYALDKQRLPTDTLSIFRWLLDRPRWKYDRSEGEVYNAMEAVYCMAQAPQPEGDR